MRKEEIEQLIIKVSARYFNDDFTDSKEFPFDSLKVLEFLLELEAELKIEFDISDIQQDKINTIAKMTKYIQGKIFM